MKAMGAFAMFLLFLAAIALINLRNVRSTDEAVFRAAVPADLVDTRWRLVAMRGTQHARHAAIELALSAENRFRASGRCHDIAGRYAHDGRTLSFLEPDLSPSRCAAGVVAHEAGLLTLLATSISADTDGERLVLLAADGTRLARFHKIAIRP